MFITKYAMAARRKASFHATIARAFIASPFRLPLACFTQSRERPER